MDTVGYQLVDAQGAVVRTWGGEWGSCPAVPNPVILPNGDHVCGMIVGQESNGFTLRVIQMEPPPPTEADYGAAIQAHIDGAARARGYDSGVALVSYLSSTNPSWAAEAATFNTWRDAVWAYAYGELAKVQGGQRAQPTIAEFVAELPQVVWP